MRVKWLAAGFLVLAVPAFATSSLIGRWFGVQPRDKNAMYLFTVNPDGTFVTQHRHCLAGKAADNYVAGTWSDGGALVTYHVATLNGFPRPRVDIFRILWRDARAEHTMFLGQNLPYDDRRVDAKFVMPSCDLVI
jgi:hypothetical protein